MTRRRSVLCPSRLFSVDVGEPLTSFNLYTSNIDPSFVSLFYNDMLQNYSKKYLAFQANAEDSFAIAVVVMAGMAVAGDSGSS